MKGLTNRQFAILEFIQTCINNDGTPPSLQIVANHFGFNSLRSVTLHLDTLERKKYITRPHTARGIQLTALGLDAVRHIVEKHPLYQMGFADGVAKQAERVAA